MDMIARGLYKAYYLLHIPARTNMKFLFVHAMLMRESYHYALHFNLPLTLIFLASVNAPPWPHPGASRAGAVASGGPAHSAMGPALLNCEQAIAARPPARLAAARARHPSNTQARHQAR